MPATYLGLPTGEKNTPQMLCTRTEMQTLQRSECSKYTNINIWTLLACLALFVFNHLPKFITTLFPCQNLCFEHPSDSNINSIQQLMLGGHFTSA